MSTARSSDAVTGNCVPFPARYRLRRTLPVTVKPMVKVGISLSVTAVTASFKYKVYKKNKRKRPTLLTLLTYLYTRLSETPPFPGNDGVSPGQSGFRSGNPLPAKSGNGLNGLNGLSIKCDRFR